MASDREIARAQYIKSKRTEVRLRYALMADAEVIRLTPVWKAEFDEMALENEPSVLDFESEARRLLSAGS